MTNKIFSAKCPGISCNPDLCEADEVLHVYKVRQGTVTVSPCKSLKAQGWIGNVAAVVWADKGTGHWINWPESVY